MKVTKNTNMNKTMMTLIKENNNSIYLFMPLA